jgi:hypothetical protein
VTLVFESHLASLVLLMRNTASIPEFKTHAYQRSSHQTERSIHSIVIGLNLSRSECVACVWASQQLPSGEFELQGDTITTSTLSQVHAAIGSDNRFQEMRLRKVGH